MLKIQTMIKMNDFQTCLILFRLNINCYDSYNSQTCLNMLKHVYTSSDSIWYELVQFMRFSNMSEHVETCLNLFRFYMIWIVMIHMILTDIWTCSNKHVKTCSDSIWYELLRFIWFSNMSELVQNQYDMNCYDSQTCLNLFRINMIWIDTIIKYVKTWQNTLKLSKWHETEDKVVPWIASSKSSGQKTNYQA